MQPSPEPLPLHVRLLHDICSLAVAAIVLVPGYLLLNQYWRSLVLLVSLYTLLGFGFIRLGAYVRRVSQRFPADIPPWQKRVRANRTATPLLKTHGHDLAVKSVLKDPVYLQDVIKPRLRQLLVYRLTGLPNATFEDLDDTHLAQLDPDLIDFLTRPETAGLWATYRYRHQRLHNLLAALQRVEAV